MKTLSRRVAIRATNKGKPTKKRVTFFMDMRIKDALACWSADEGISESAALESLLEEMLPPKYLKRPD